MIQEYYIVSLKHTLRRNRYITFWRPDDKGYAWPLSWAGRYQESVVRENLGYYNNGHCTIAVPCSVVDALAVPPLPGSVDGDAGLVVNNRKKNWDVIIAAAIEHPLNAVRPEYMGAPRAARGGL